MNDTAAPPQNYGPPPKQGKGCFFWGCIIVLVLGLLGLLVVGVSSYFLYDMAMSSTSEQAEPVPQVVVAEDAARQVEEKVRAFRNGGPGSTLSLSAEELNAVTIGNNSELNGKVYFRIEGDRVLAECSVPIPENVPFVGGRYFNGEVDVAPSVEDGALKLEAESARVGDKTFDKATVDEFFRQLVKEFRDNPDATEFREFFEEVKDLQVRDGNITLTR